MESIVFVLWLITSSALVNAGSLCNQFYKDVCSLEEPEKHHPSSNIDLLKMLKGEQQIFDTKCKHEPKCYCSNNQKYFVHVICSNANLTTIPTDLPSNTSFLDLSGNLIKEVPNKAFIKCTKLEKLYMSYNKIETLASDAFSGLTRLQFLSISRNKLRYTAASFPRQVFTPLDNLISLQMHQNLSDIADDEDYPMQALLKLKSLSCLHIDWMPHKTLIQFSNLSSLRLLAFSGKKGRCDMEHVTTKTFENLTQITTLSIRNCGLKMTENGSFSHMKSLQVLDLSNNDKLGLKNMVNFTNGLENTQLTLLNITHITPTFSDCQRLTADDLKYVSNLNIKTVIFDENNLSYIALDAVQFIPKNIKCVSFRRNIMLLGPYIPIMFLKNTFRNVEVVDISEQRINAREDDNIFKRNAYTFKLDNSEINSTRLNNIPSDKKGKHVLHVDDSPQDKYTIGVNCTNCAPYRTDKKFVTLLFPKNIHTFDMSNIKVELPLDNGYCYCEPNSLTILDMSKNNYWKWQGPFIGLSNLKMLNLSSNNAKEVSNGVFHNMTKLSTLDLSRNVLSYSLSLDESGLIFSKQHSLKHLNLSDNKIQTIPKSFFSGLKNVKILKLNNNLLTHINFDVHYMTSLRWLDLSYNLLETVSDSTGTQLDTLSTVKPVYLDISNNILACTCKDIYFVRWIANSAVYFVNMQTYTCKFSNGTVKKLSSRENAQHIYSALDKECANYTILILVTSFAILFALVIAFGGLLYRYRWDIRYMYYSAKFRFFKKRGYIPVRNMDDDEFEHDVFVSYADNDRRYVKQTVVPELEEKRHLKLLIHDRDFIAGNFVSENIMKAISVSRKTLIVMTPSFVASYWCCFEMNMARKEAIHTGRDVVCVLMKEHVPQGKLPLEIQDIIRNQTYADLPDGDEHQQQFWDSLKESLLSE